jgi:hypothetical protein
MYINKFLLIQSYTLTRETRHSARQTYPDKGTHMTMIGDFSDTT